MKAINKDIKTVNKYAIAKYIYQKKAVTKQEIAYNLNMSLPTVFQNTKELEKWDLKKEIFLQQKMMKFQYN